MENGAFALIFQMHDISYGSKGVIMELKVKGLNFGLSFHILSYLCAA